MEEACKKAIARGGDNSQNARVVGIAITYMAVENPNGFGINNTTKNKSFTSMFGKPTASELPDAYGWGTRVNPATHNLANGSDNWRDYIYKVGAADNPDSAYSSGVNSKGWRVLVVAVTDSEPEHTGFLKLHKSSADTSITG